MEKFWGIFWKAFGISLVLAVVAGLIIGFVSGSSGIISAVIMGVIAVGFGACGVIGLVVVPVQMFIEDRMAYREAENAIK
jgi:hypothetical protein